MAIKSVNPDTIAEAAELLRTGALVAFATETVYGLGANARNPDAVARIFSAKARPQFNPLIVHVPDLAAAQQYGVFSSTAQKLAHAFWPGAVTLVVPIKPDADIADLVTAGLNTIAIRVPNHPFAQRLLRAAACPLAAPSANRSGAVSPTCPEHVATDLGDRVAMILDGGSTALGLESTVLQIDDDRVALLRPGAVTRQAVETLLGHDVLTVEPVTTAPTAPGQLASHYAPHARVRLNVNSVNAGEALLAFGPRPPRTDGPTINLSPAADVNEAAVHLFAALRTLDASGVSSIAVMPIPDTGLGEAINDRLRRAAAPRD